MTPRAALAADVRKHAPDRKLLTRHLPFFDALADALDIPRDEPSAGAIEPPWMAIARAQIGVREVIGAKHSPVIMGWIQEIGAKALGLAVNDDETPWCGTFMAWVMKQAGLSMPAVPVRAASWGRAGAWGRELIAPRPGCILVFTRDGGGHVGLYVGEDATHFHVLGGNQSNSVSITRIAKSRLAPGGMRWPKGPELPAAHVVRLTPAGVPITTNEA